MEEVEEEEKNETSGFDERKRNKIYIYICYMNKKKIKSCVLCHVA